MDAHFRPEFINRIDELIVFDMLQQNGKTITSLFLADLNTRLEDQELSFTANQRCWMNWLSAAMTVYGARPLRRTFQRMIEDPLKSYRESSISLLN